MPDELEVEDGAEPAYGDCVGDDTPVDNPVVVLGHLELQYSAALEDGKGDAPSDGQESDDGRGADDEIPPEIPPQTDHCPGLVHESGLDDDDEDDRKGVCGEAEIVGATRHEGVIQSPDGVEVIESRREPSDEKNHADGADD